ncbi:MAG: tetratricopeptide repeat protein [Paludibacteraceae bacterium]|nr:tetratricopeptide repeat protein [Paludibacteraceae bacterium]
MKVSLLLLFLTTFVSIFAQNVQQSVRDGNKLYENEKYGDAEVSYRKGLEKDRYSLESTYNLGNALYKQKNYEAAASEYQKAIVLAKEDKNNLAKSYHNLGNALYQQKKYAESVDAYKKSLLKNPKDDETRKNLALAQLLLKKEQSSSSENQNKEEEEKNHNEKDPASTEQISKDNAEQILNSFSQDEAAILQQLQQQQINATKRKLDKDW